MRGNAPLSHITGTPGWEVPSEQDELYAVAQSLPEGSVILEIGGEFSMSASIFSKGAPTARIYSVDIAFAGEVGEIHKANLAEAGLGENVKRIAADSHDKATVAKFRKLEKGTTPLTILFVDGDHTFEGALLDLQMWTPLIKIGGKLLIHDTATPANPLPHPLHFEVSRAVSTWLKDEGANWKEVKVVNTLMVLERIA